MASVLRFNNTHRYFIQFMLQNGQVQQKDAFTYYSTKIAPGSSLTDLKTLIIEINREIQNNNFKIAQSVCEVTGKEIIAWLHLKNDEISRLQSIYSPIELEYFNALMQEILQAESGQYMILYPRCINITSTLTGNYSRENGEKALLRWIKGGYFTKVEHMVYLGARLILEFASYLRSRTDDDCICGLCSELSFVGKTCGKCSKKFHSHCINKYLGNQKACPSCRKEWIENDDDNVREGEYNSSDSMDDD